MTAILKNEHTYTYIGQFSSGIMVGNFQLTNQTTGSVFIGTIDNFEPAQGTTTFSDGYVTHGLYQAGVLYNGIAQKPGPHGQTIKLSIENGLQVGASEAEQIAAIEQRFRPKHSVRMTKVRLDSSKTCLADLPAAEYSIEGDFGGRCKDGYYTGKAKLKLTPKAGQSGRAMSLTVKYQAGQISGPVELNFNGTSAKYKGTLVNWQPHSGNWSEPVGNDNYHVIELQDGLQAAERTERREPSFGTLLGQTIVRSLVTSLQDCLQGRCAQERAAARAEDQRRQETAAYQQQQAQAAEQQRQNSIAAQQQNDAYNQQQAEWKRQSDATIEDARQKQLAGLDRDGNPLTPSAPPVVIAQADPVPVFGGDTKPPEPEFRIDTNPPAPTVTTNPPDFGGSTSPPEREFRADTNPPVENTAPSIPEPRPSEPSIPDPIRGDAPSAPVQDMGVPGPIIGDADRAPPPLAPAARIPDPYSSPSVAPVQPTTQSDTLGTGPVPSYPVPQSEPVVGPATPSQPASNASTQNYGSTPAAYAQQLSGSDLALNNRLSPSNPQRIENQMSAGQLGQIIRSGQIADWRTETQAAINRQNGTQTAGNSAGSGGSQTADIPQVLALGAPRPLAPTNPGELNSTVPLQWSGVTGATYYQLAVRDLTTNDLVVNLTVNGTSHTAPPYTAKRTFRWNVAACNAAGCSPNRSESWTFRTGGVSGGGQAGSGNFVTGAAQAVFDANLECAKGIAARTGQSVASISQWVTSLSWRGVLNDTASGLRTFWNHPWVATKAVASGIWNGGLAGAKASYQQFVETASRSYQPEQAFELCSNATQAAVTTVGAVDGAKGIASAAGGGFAALKRLVERPAALGDELQSAAPIATALKYVFYNGSTVYRGDSRSAGNIFPSGFTPRGTSTDLVQYVRSGTASAFVGTSKVRGKATSFGGAPNYVYEIDATKLRGIDVNATIGPHTYDIEWEVAFEGGVPSSAIRGAWPILSSGGYGPYQVNPYFK